MQGKKKLLDDCVVFAVVPVDLIQGLSGNALKVFASLASHTESYQPSTNKIAFDSGIHRITVYKALKELQTKGVIRNTHFIYYGAGYKKQKIYSFCPQGEWRLTTPQQKLTPEERPNKSEVVGKEATEKRAFKFPTEEEKLAAYRAKSAQRRDNQEPEGL